MLEFDPGAIPLLLHNRHPREYQEFREQSESGPDQKVFNKCADVSNPARPLRVTAEWTQRISEEFFRHTEDEAALGLPLTLPR